MSQFNEREVCYYVNPFSFDIEKVMLGFKTEDVEEGVIYFINKSVCLPETDLRKNLIEAQQLAKKYLEKFYFQKLNEIELSNPQFDFGDYEDEV